jgi:hypothetical protein
MEEKAREPQMGLNFDYVWAALLELHEIYKETAKKIEALAESSAETERLLKENSVETDKEIMVLSPEPWVMSPEPWVMSPELWVMSPELWVMSPEPWVMSPELWVMSPELQTSVNPLLFARGFMALLTKSPATSLPLNSRPATGRGSEPA